jgi:hypothetical protein
MKLAGRKIRISRIVALALLAHSSISPSSHPPAYPSFSRLVVAVMASCVPTYCDVVQLSPVKIYYYIDEITNCV